MESGQYNRIFDEDEKQLLNNPPKFTPLSNELNKALMTMSKSERLEAIQKTAQELDDEAIKMPKELIKKMKNHADRLKLYGYSDKLIKRMTAEKFHFEIYTKKII